MKKKRLKEERSGCDLFENIDRTLHLRAHRFLMNVSVSTSLGMKRNLTGTAVPTVDVAGIVVPSIEELISSYIGT